MNCTVPSARREREGSQVVQQPSEAALGEPQPFRTDARGDSECIQRVPEFQNATARVKTFSPPPHCWCFSYLFVLDQSRRSCP